MFLKLDSYSAAVHAPDPLSLQPFVHLLQSVLEEAGGFLRQFLVDDKVRERPRGRAGISPNLDPPSDYSVLVPLFPLLPCCV
jgi:hypothetical protein